MAKNPFKSLNMKSLRNMFRRGRSNAAAQPSAPEAPAEQGSRSATASPDLFRAPSHDDAAAVRTGRTPSPVAFASSAANSRAVSPLVFEAMTFSSPAEAGVPTRSGAAKASAGDAFGRDAGVTKNVSRKGKAIDEMSITSVENMATPRELMLKRHKSEEALHPRENPNTTYNTLRRQATEASDHFDSMKIAARERVASIKAKGLPPLTATQQKAVERDRERDAERNARRQDAGRQTLGSNRTASQSAPNVSSARSMQGQESAVPPVPAFTRAPGASQTSQSSPTSSRSSSPTKSTTNKVMSEKARGKQRDPGPSLD